MAAAVKSRSSRSDMLCFLASADSVTAWPCMTVDGGRLGNRPVEGKRRQVMPEAVGQDLQSSDRIADVAESCQLPFCVRFGLADDRANARQDLQVIGISPELGRTSPQVCGECFRRLQFLLDRIDDLRDGCGEIAAGVRCAGLNDDRVALRRPRDIERTVDREIFSFVIEDVHLVGIGEATAKLCP